MAGGNTGRRAPPVKGIEKQTFKPVNESDSGLLDTAMSSESSTVKRKTVTQNETPKKRSRLSLTPDTPLSAYQDIYDPTKKLSAHTFAVEVIPDGKTVFVDKRYTTVCNLIARDKNSKTLEISIWDELAQKFVEDCQRATFPLKVTFHGGYPKKANDHILPVDCLSHTYVISAKGGFTILQQYATNHVKQISKFTDVKSMRMAAGHVFHNIIVEIFSPLSFLKDVVMFDVSDGVHRGRMTMPASISTNEYVNGSTIKVSSFTAKFDVAGGCPIFTISTMEPPVFLCGPDDNGHPESLNIMDDSEEAIPWLDAN